MKQILDYIKTLYKRRGMKFRLYVVLLVFMFVPIIGIVLYVWQYSLHSFQVTVENAATESFQAKNRQLESYIANLNNLSQSITSDPQLEYYIKQDYNSSFTAWRIGHLVQEYVSVPTSDLMGIFIETNKENEYLIEWQPNQYVFSIRGDHKKKYEELEMIAKKQTDEIYSKVCYLEGEKCIAISFPITTKEQEKIGRLLILCNHSKIFDMVEPSSSKLAWDFSLETGEDVLCVGSRYLELVEGAGIQEEVFEEIGWKLICAVNIKEQLQKESFIFLVILVIIMAIYVLILFLMALLVDQQAVQIQNLIKEQKDIEMKSLELEINPHFLANTLNTINSVAIEHKEYQISRMLKSFSLIFNYIIRDRHKPVSIRQEVEWLEDYLLLQKERFDSSFNYEVDLDPKVADERIYKMILQPFIENSIVHGFEKMHEKGMLTCIFTRKDEMIQIILSDNGQGISEETLKILQKLLEDPSAEIQEQYRVGIGIVNSCRRLKGYYGKDYRVQLESSETNGTKVTIFIPCLRGTDI